MASSRTEKYEEGSVQRAYKIGLVGDGTVGKTTMLMTYTMQAFVKDYIPTVFDNFAVVETIENVRINASLWDTAGQEDYVAVRKVCYDRTDLFMVCFSVMHPNSFHNIRSKWLPELRDNSPGTPWVLVGTKTDLVDDADAKASLDATGEKSITASQANKLKKEEGAEEYITCTGKEVESVNAAFRKALQWLVVRDNKALAKNLKKWKKDAAKEEKLEKELEKMRLKEEQNNANNNANNAE